MLLADAAGWLLSLLAEYCRCWLVVVTAGWLMTGLEGRADEVEKTFLIKVLNLCGICGLLNVGSLNLPPKKLNWAEAMPRTKVSVNKMLSFMLVDGDCRNGHIFCSSSLSTTTTTRHRR